MRFFQNPRFTRGQQRDHADVLRHVRLDVPDDPVLAVRARLQPARRRRADDPLRPDDDGRRSAVGPARRAASAPSGSSRPACSIDRRCALRRCRSSTPTTPYPLVITPVLPDGGRAWAWRWRPATESVMGSLPREKAGVGSAVNDTTRQMGGALGVAIIGSVVSSVYAGGAAEVSREHGVTGVDAGPGTLVTRRSARGRSSAARPRRRQRLRCRASRTASSTPSATACAEWLVILVAAFVAWRFLPARADDPLAIDASDGRAAGSTTTATPSWPAPWRATEHERASPRASDSAGTVLGSQVHHRRPERVGWHKGAPVSAAGAARERAATPIDAVRRGRPRDADADEAILSATLELLAEAGVGGLSMDVLAQRAGVGKATIYRRWASKEALMLDALRHQAPIPAPDKGTLRDDLLAYTDGRRRAVRAHPRLGRAAPPDRGQLLRRAAAPRRSTSTTAIRQRPMRLILRRGIERGELAAGRRRRPRRRRRARRVLLPPARPRRALHIGLRRQGGRPRDAQRHSLSTQRASPAGAAVCHGSV